jgi:hypothetical protein
MTDANDAWLNHWKAYAEAFVQPLQGNSLVSRFVANPVVTGTYTEAWVRSTARNMLGTKFRISTGAVVRSSAAVRGLQGVQQCDLIVWDPSELPGLFERGEFALVPLASVRAVIELKRRIRSAPKLTQQLKRLERLARPAPVLGVVLRHHSPLFERECTPDWLQQDHSEPAVTRLLDRNHRPDTNGVMAYIYFLAQVAGHNRRVVA